MTVRWILTYLAFAASVVSFALRYEVAGVALASFSVLMFIWSLFGGDRGKTGGHGR